MPIRGRANGFGSPLVRASDALEVALALEVRDDLLEARLTVAQRIVGVHYHTRRLETLLHVCAWCKQIRDQGSWVTLESYLQKQTGTPLTHGICPSCTAKWRADPDWKG